MRKFEFDTTWDLTIIILCFALAFYLMFNTNAVAEYFLKTLMV